MIITLPPKWTLHEVRRGVSIMRRLAKTGTSGGNWLTPGTYWNTLAKARSYIDGLPTGHYCGPGNLVKD